jgi:hypothetical protein
MLAQVVTKQQTLPQTLSGFNHVKVMNAWDCSVVNLSQKTAVEDQDSQTSKHSPGALAEKLQFAWLLQ